MDSLFNLALVIKAVDNASGPIRALGAQVDGLGKRLSHVGHQMTEWGERQLVAGALVHEVGERAGRVFEAMVEPAMASAHVMAQFESTVQVSREAIEQLEHASVAYSNTLPGTEEQFVHIAQSMAQVTKEHEHLDNAIAGTRAVAKLAALTGADIDTVAGIVGRAFRTMGDVTQPVGPQMERITEILNATRKAFPIADMGTFAQGLAQLGPVAGALHVPMQEVFTLLASVQGAIGSKGTMQFAAALGGVLGSRKKLHEFGLRPQAGLFAMLDQIRGRLVHLGTLGRVAKLEELFGPGQGKAMLAVMDRLQALKKASLDAGGATGQLGADLRRLQAADPSLRLKVFHQQLDNLKKTIGTTVLPELTRLVKGIGHVITTVQGFAKAHPAIAKAGMAILGIATPTLPALAAMSLATPAPPALPTPTGALVFADGTFRGHVVITEIVETTQVTAPDGSLIAAHCTVRLTEYVQTELNQEQQPSTPAPAIEDPAASPSRPSAPQQVGVRPVTTTSPGAPSPDQATAADAVRAPTYGGAGGGW
jgi:TP901 family phage tail tape measure protein